MPSSGVFGPVEGKGIHRLCSCILFSLQASSSIEMARTQSKYMELVTILKLVAKFWSQGEERQKLESSC